MQENTRRQAISLVMQLRSAAEAKRTLVLDPTIDKADYDAAHEAWAHI